MTDVVCKNCRALTHREDSCPYEPEIRIAGAGPALEFTRKLYQEHRTFKSMNVHNEFIFLVKKIAYTQDLPEAK